MSGSPLCYTVIMIRTMFKKADFLLLAVLVVVGVIASVALARTGKDGGAVVLSKSGREIGRYALDEEINILVSKDGEMTTYPAGNELVFEEMPQDYNIVRIHGSKVSVLKADCRSQVCVDHKPISKAGESIICLPHKLVVEIVSPDDADGYDAIAK